MKKLFAVLLLLALLCPLVSCGESYGEPSAVHSVNGFSVELYETDGVVTRIKTVAPNGKTNAFKCRGLGFEATDLNFDGHDDFSLSDADGEGRILAFIYQPNSRTFTFSRALSELIDPQFDAETRQVTGRIHKLEYYSDREGEVSGYRETRAWGEYEFVSGTLTQISERGIYHDSDGELYCVYKAEFVDGELVYDYADEKWYYLDELIAAGYEW